ncbi:MAG: prenyltransferase/squalene oxidase repeat-containing protein [Candidatus Ranarchaeia archaeon]
MKSLSLIKLSKKIPLLVNFPSNRILPAYALPFEKIITNVIPYVISLQQDDGGFSRRPEDKTSLIWATGQSLIILAQTNSLDDFDPEKTIEWITKCQTDEGGFDWKPNVNRPNVENTMYALVSLTILDGLSKIHLQKAIDFLLNRQLLGGFTTDEESTESSTWATYNAIIALTTINKLDKIDSKEIGKFVKSCQILNGSIEKHQGRKDATVYSTASSLFLLSIIDQLNIIDMNSSLKFISDKQCFDGGFPYDPLEIPGNESGQTWSTGHVITALSVSHNLSSINIEKIIQFFIDRQMSNGGFVFKKDQNKTDTNVSAAFMAVVGLYRMLEPIVKVETPKVDDLPILILKILSNTNEIELNNLSLDLKISKYILKGIISRLIHQDWLKGELIDDSFIVGSTIPINEIEKENEKVKKIRTNFSRMFSELESDMNSLKYQVQQPTNDKTYFNNSIDAKIIEIKKKIENFDFQLKKDFKKIIFHPVENIFSDFLLKWIIIKEKAKKDFEKINFTRLWVNKKKKF